MLLPGCSNKLQLLCMYTAAYRPSIQSSIQLLLMEQQYQIPSQSSANYTKMLQAWLETRITQTNYCLYIYDSYMHVSIRCNNTSQHRLDINSEKF